MKSLVLDCSAGMNVFLEIDEKIFSVTEIIQNKHSDEILKVIDELLHEAKITINQIDNICVCVGPGSFTGVRVAISLAKGLSVGSGAKVFTLSNFDIFDTKNLKNYYLVLDGFSNFVYVRKCENGEIFDECCALDEFVSCCKKDGFEVFVTTEKTQNLLKNFEIKSILAKNQTIFAFNKKIKSNENVELNEIYPVYLRASQAEIERAKKM